MPEEKMNKETLFQIKSRIDYGEFITKGRIYNVIKEQPNGMYVIEPDDVGLMCGIEKEFTEPVETDADKQFIINKLQREVTVQQYILSNMSRLGYRNKELDATIEFVVNGLSDQIESSENQRLTEQLEKELNEEDKIILLSSLLKEYLDNQGNGDKSIKDFIKCYKITKIS